MKITITFLILTLSASVFAQKVTKWNKNIGVRNIGIYKQSLDSYKQFYVAIDASTDFGDEANKVRYSSDGGNNWITILQDKHFNFDENFNPLPGAWQTRYFHAIDIVSPNHIYLIAQDDLRSDEDETLYPFIYKTNDKGKNWKRINICNLEKGSFRNYLSMVDSLRGFIFTVDCLNNEKRSVYFTDDGFETMEVLNLEEESIYPISFEAIDNNTLIIGTKSFVYTTIDGGINWELKNSPKDVTGFNFINVNVGYATGSFGTGLGGQKIGVIYKTTDGGESWKKLFEEQKENFLTGLDAINFRDENNGLAVGRMKIYRTQDAGKTWNFEELPFEIYQDPLRSVRYGTKDNAAIYGFNLINTNWNTQLASPRLQVTNLQPYDLDYKIEWNEIEGANNYEFQLAEYNITSFPTYTPPVEFESIMTYSTYIKDEFEVNIFDYIQYSKYYYLRVRAMNNIDTSQWSRYISFKTEQKPDVNVLTTPKLISPKNFEHNLPVNNLNFSWFDLPAAVKYDLVIRKDINMPDPENDIVIPGIVKSEKIVDGLDKKTTYYWYVHASDKEGNIKTSNYREFNTSESTSNINFLNEQLIELFPNPAVFTINFDVSEYIKDSRIEIRVNDLFGKIIIKLVEPNPGLINLDISNLTSGVYFLVVKGENSSYKTKFVKK
ncbi:YCF48-related protein [Psychroserpens sp.]|uniref:T9SS type A sorting domain-containing protein n=1 Tax=Psychroserpens sp. TaxID=2020870 RepID=UPI002B265661|nr:YCF48-related protein [Psychroserpens sp.]